MLLNCSLPKRLTLCHVHFTSQVPAPEEPSHKHERGGAEAAEMEAAVTLTCH